MLRGLKTLSPSNRPFMSLQYHPENTNVTVEEKNTTSASGFIYASIPTDKEGVVSSNGSRDLSRAHTYCVLSSGPSKIWSGTFRCFFHLGCHLPHTRRTGRTVHVFSCCYCLVQFQSWIHPQVKWTLWRLSSALFKPHVQGILYLLPHVLVPTPASGGRTWISSINELVESLSVASEHN